MQNFKINAVPLPALTGQAAAANAWKYYAIDVPAGTKSIKFDINGNNGDADMFTQLSSKPTNAAYKCKSDGPSAVETCSLTNPAAGRYYLGVFAYSAYNNLSVTATYSTAK